MTDRPEDKFLGLGPTGKFPHGKIDPDDEGELTCKVEREGDVIKIDFGKSVKWIGFDPDGAIEFAKALLHYAGVTHFAIKREPKE